MKTGRKRRDTGPYVRLKPQVIEGSAYMPSTIVVAALVFVAAAIVGLAMWVASNAGG